MYKSHLELSMWSRDLKTRLLATLDQLSGRGLRRGRFQDTKVRGHQKIGQWDEKRGRVDASMTLRTGFIVKT